MYNYYWLVWLLFSDLIWLLLQSGLILPCQDYLRRAEQCMPQNHNHPTLRPDPPENCHLKVKNCQKIAILKNCHFFQKIAKNCNFFQKIAMAIFWKKIQFLSSFCHSNGHLSGGSDVDKPLDFVFQRCFLLLLTQLVASLLTDWRCRCSCCSCFNIWIWIAGFSWVNMRTIILLMRQVGRQK